MSKNLGDIYTKPLKDRAGPTSPHLPFLQSLVSFSPASLRTRASLDFNPSFFFSDSSGSFSGGLVGSSLPGALLFLRVIPSGSSLMGLRTQWALLSHFDSLTVELQLLSPQIHLWQNTPRHSWGFWFSSKSPISCSSFALTYSSP